MNIIKRLFNGALATAAVFTFGLLAAGCSDDDKQTPFVPSTPLGITGYGLTDRMVVTVGEPVTIVGNGFLENDKIVLRTSTGTQYGAHSEVSYEKYIEFQLDAAAIPEGPYTVLAVRGNEEQTLGKTNLSYILNPDVPAVGGKNLRGMVYCGSKGVPGVMVSDGVEVTLTDDNGFYYLESQKKHGYIFITIPSGYMPEMDGSLPDFWRTLQEGVMVDEQHHFKLYEVDNTDHIMLFTADLHLANRNSDLANYESIVIADVENYVKTLPDVPVYSMSLGDMSWDTYWVDNGFAISDYMALAREFPVPVFHTMGNHDNDPGETGDFNSEIEYKLRAGPTYYSMNIGEAHYVVLDNIINRSQGDYYRNVTQEQYEWLLKDLAYVTDKSSPLIVCMHSQTYTVTGITPDGTITVGKHYNGGNEGVGTTKLSSAWADFDDVTIMSGHAHINRYVPKGRIDEAPNTRELNMGATGGTWWWTTTFTPLILCPNGSPGGFMRMDFNGKNQKWKYKGANFDDGYQFRVFDMNTVKNYYKHNENAKKYLAGTVAQVGTPDDFSWAADNSILVNVFAMDENWTVRIEEEIDGQWTNVDYIYKMARDPLHNISYDIPRFVANGEITTGFATQDTPHMIYAELSRINTTVRVTAVDPFGETYRQVVKRPRDFEVEMD